MRSWAKRGVSESTVPVGMIVALGFRVEGQGFTSWRLVPEKVETNDTTPLADVQNVVPVLVREILLERGTREFEACWL